ncbi:hypothetical protein A6E01_19430 (plasmid) [Vibrio breoganii]|uniref:Uncharacterized protein n=2 Tax=Vibrio TaxID=662 RepID=A0AAN0XZJ5_9VIBR|nr:hypothetical protein [Vibrio breoganii]ANO35387.1 hypothetical protein A6E01_19430 [Vibrio breoganii]PML12691.1 hypothetical protein BCT84_02075 [Vibrio breoganii]
MKTIEAYIGDKQTVLMETYGAFYAFSNYRLMKQLERAEELGFSGNKEDYVQDEGGLVCMIEHMPHYQTELAKLYREAEQQQQRDYSRQQIILHELHNYECFLLSDPQEAIESLAVRGFTKEEIIEVYGKHYKNAVAAI